MSTTLAWPAFNGLGKAVRIMYCTLVELATKSSTMQSSPKGRRPCAFVTSPLRARICDVLPRLCAKWGDEAHHRLHHRAGPTFGLFFADDERPLLADFGRSETRPEIWAD